ncbi:type II toxin-antitoxin system CcdA family antitoxin [Budvicia diplopodorum]|uniref:type II toxin-antitoxin system CcdA family antitoxin n=1 Tax=Budvicia diplopodorum TaxID=1119056 RepID=UPI0013598220|nr:type II toxin-antitoxin system CcdA family antitoxin [Budvicia diplopodorum]
MREQTTKSPKTPKTPTNIYLETHVVEEAKSLNINLSAACNDFLKQEVRARKRQRFIEESKGAIASCNEFTQRAGLVSDEFGVLSISQF